jgi:hypothetical protein
MNIDKKWKVGIDVLDNIRNAWLLVLDPRRVMAAPFLKTCKKRQEAVETPGLREMPYERDDRELIGSCRCRHRSLP